MIQYGIDEGIATCTDDMTTWNTENPGDMIELAKKRKVLMSMKRNNRVMSFNIRQDRQRDGKNNWIYRMEKAASMLRFHHVDIAGLQEAFRHQVNDLEKLLPDYSWIGVGREDGVDKGEFVPIFYRTSRFDLLEHGTFWLSENSEVKGSLGWDAECVRITTWGRFFDKELSRIFYFYNTHLDHHGEVARVKGTQLIVNHIKENVGNQPAILVGDFNATKESELYGILSGDESPLTDARLCSRNGHHGPSFTFHGFKANELMLLEQRQQEAENTELLNPIDFIFGNENVEVVYHGILADQWDGFYPSDHMPVVADVKWTLD